MNSLCIRLLTAEVETTWWLSLKLLCRWTLGLSEEFFDSDASLIWNQFCCLYLEIQWSISNSGKYDRICISQTMNSFKLQW